MTIPLFVFSSRIFFFFYPPLGDQNPSLVESLFPKRSLLKPHPSFIFKPVETHHEFIFILTSGRVPSAVPVSATLLVGSLNDMCIEDHRGRGEQMVERGRARVIEGGGWSHPPPRSGTFPPHLPP